MAMDLPASLASNQDPILTVGSFIQVECSRHRFELGNAAREQDGLVAQVPYHFWNALDVRVQNYSREIPVSEDPPGHIEQARRLWGPQVKYIDSRRLRSMNEIDMLIKAIHYKRL